MPQPPATTPAFVTEFVVGREGGAYLGWVDFSRWEGSARTLRGGFDGEFPTQGSCTAGSRLSPLQYVSQFAFFQSLEPLM